MKILQISNYYYPHIGGIEQVAQDCAEAFKGNFEQKVFCFNHEKKNVTEEVDGVEVVRAGSFTKVASQSLSFSYGKLLKKTFREFNPDIVIFHYPNPFGAHYLLKILKKYPRCKLVIYWHLDITKQKILRKLFHRQNIKLCKVATKVVGATPAHLNQSRYYNFFKDKCQLLPYCINENALKLGEEDLNLIESIKAQNIDKVICFAMGRHVPYKGIINLVRASKLLDADYRIYIAGEGPLTDELKKEAKGDEKVVFLGKINDAQRRAYLNACDIFCFPSVTRNEGFGLALAEAMYCKKPAVTFTIAGSGVNYVNLNGVTGLEVENSNVEAYADAIRTLAQNNELRVQYGRSAQERVIENFSISSFRTNIIKFMEELK